MSGFEAFVLVWCVLALMLGGLIKGTLGVGTPLLTVPLMAMVLPVHLAITLMAAPVLLANVWQMLQAGGALAAVRRFWPVFVAILAGTLAGAKILSVIAAGLLLVTVGALAAVFAVAMYAHASLRLPLALERPAGVVMGLVSGLVGGLSSMFGPPLIAYLSALHLRRETFVSVIGFLYLSAVVPWVASLLFFGIMDARSAGLSLLATLPVMLGMYLGQRLRRHLPEDRFRKVVLGVLLASGIAMLVRGLSL